MQPNPGIAHKKELMLRFMEMQFRPRYTISSSLASSPHLLFTVFLVFCSPIIGIHAAYIMRIQLFMVLNEVIRIFSDYGIANELIGCAKSQVHNFRHLHNLSRNGCYFWSMLVAMCFSFMVICWVVFILFEAFSCEFQAKFLPTNRLHNIHNKALATNWCCKNTVVKSQAEMPEKRSAEIRIGACSVLTC